MKKTPARDRGLYNLKGLRREGHIWGPPMIGHDSNSNAQVCRKCKKPKFIVDGFPCKSRRKA